MQVFDSATNGSDQGAVALGSILGPRKLFERFTILLPLQTFVVFFFQILVVYLIFGPFQSPADILRSTTGMTSVAGAFIVNATASLTFRQFRSAPSRSRFALVLPSYLAPITVLFVALLGLRLNYSNYILFSGIAAGASFLYLATLLQRPTSGRTFYIVPGDRTRAMALNLRGLTFKVLGKPSDLMQCRDGAVVVDLSQDLSSEWERSIAHAVVAGIPVYNAKQVEETLTGRVQVERMSENSFGALEPALSYLIVKRGIDILASCLGLVTLAIPMTLIALAIRLQSPGPALYRHRRVGHRGQAFDTIKFRTMQSREPDDDDLESQKTKGNDPRVTAVGRFLRNTRLDELPQLINVLRGEMSLIGPRPEALALSRWYDEHLDFYEYRHVIRPGITGWAQVNQGHVTEIEDVYVKLQYDFYYIKHVSAWLDLLIAFRTLVVMVSWRGAR